MEAEVGPGEQVIGAALERYEGGSPGDEAAEEDGQVEPEGAFVVDVATEEACEVVFEDEVVPRLETVAGGGEEEPGESDGGSEGGDY